MKAQLDFNDYPDITEGDIFWRPPPSALQQVPQLYERATSALYMLFLSGGSDIPIRDGVPAALHVAMHVRAALTEFVGIEEAMKNADTPIGLRAAQVHFFISCGCFATIKSTLVASQWQERPWI